MYCTGIRILEHIIKSASVSNKRFHVVQHWNVCGLALELSSPSSGASSPRSWVTLIAGLRYIRYTHPLNTNLHTASLTLKAHIDTAQSTYITLIPSKQQIPQNGTWSSPSCFRIWYVHTLNQFMSSRISRKKRTSSCILIIIRYLYWLSY